MTKRCKNCGWPNDDNNQKCEKCNVPLETGPSSREYSQTARESYSQTARESFSQTARETGGESLRRTISENQFFQGNDSTRDEPNTYQDPSGTSSGELNCPNCGYPVRQGMRSCPNCGTPLTGSANNGAKNANNSANRMGTINPWMRPDNGAFCSLKPIAWVGENVSHQPLTFSGESVVLNRANTDPNNHTITSAEQAQLSFEGGEWYILDKSALHTTYVLASQKIKLHKGDTIVLGNRLFEFNYD